jgi:hypothetical protein
LIWDVDGEARRDDVVIGDEQANGPDAHVVIFDSNGRRRATSPDELPAGSVLLLPPDASDRDVERIEKAGYTAERQAEPTNGHATSQSITDDELAEPYESEADVKARQAAIEAAEAELDEVIKRSTRQAQARHPELFDAQGKIRKDLVARKIRERMGGKTRLTREEYTKLTGGDLGPWRPPASDAP